MANMSGSTDRASLLMLPHELMCQIIRDPVNLDSKPEHWLPIARLDEPYYEEQSQNGHNTEAHELLLELRALSQTCASLRAFMLPLLWRWIDVRTIDELGRLQEYLSIAPLIAPLIRSFSFSWDLNGDWAKLDPYPDERGSVLDMAFIDRGALWTETREGFGYDDDVLHNDIDEDDHGLCFRHHGVKYREPGLPVDTTAGAKRRRNLYKVAKDGSMLYAQHGNGIASSGPDGEGIDSRIKSPDEFRESMDTVVASLVSLAAFEWRCPVTYMPHGTLTTLVAMGGRLTTLYLDLRVRRSPSGLLPFWGLASSLTSLSIHLDFQKDFAAHPQHIVEEIDEATSEDDFPSFFPPFTSGNLGPLPPKPSMDALHYRIACMTIVAAARGGYLRRLQLDGHKVQEPFAMRSLVPAWMSTEMYQDVGSFAMWLNKRSFLIIRLGHASLWLPHGHSGPRDSRYLSGAEVQTVLLHDSVEGALTEKYLMYLRWAMEDAELAERIAHVWNTLVDSGRLPDVLCHCTDCKRYPTSKDTTYRSIGLGTGLDNP